MLLTSLFCFWQIAADPVRPAEQARLEAASQTVQFDRSKEDARRSQKRDFEKRFNELIDAIRNFSTAYNQSAGSAWPADKARALDRAMRKLAQSEQLKSKE